MKNPRANLPANFKKATIEMLLLKLLSEEDMYGYQLSQELKKRSNGTYTILEGSMYPILYRLEDKNYIRAYDQKVGVRQTHVYYHLEESGHEYFKELNDLYHSLTDIIEFLLQSSAGDAYDKDTIQ